MKKKFGTLGFTILTTTLYICCIGLGFYILTVWSLKDVGPVTIVLAAFLLCAVFVFSITSVFFAVGSAFSSGLFKLSVLAVSYLCIILTFSGTYLIIQVVTEHGEATEEVLIKRRGWTPEGGTILGFERDSTMTIWEDAKPGADKNDRISLRIKSSHVVRDLIVDCFHYSVSTITTLGPGDWKPNSWLVKILTDIECLIGFFLIGLALGLYIRNKNHC